MFPEAYYIHKIPEISDISEIKEAVYNKHGSRQRPSRCHSPCEVTPWCPPEALNNCIYPEITIRRSGNFFDSLKDDKIRVYFNAWASIIHQKK
jgi:hypothetical protein